MSRVRKDLQAIFRSPAAGSLSSEALGIGFKVETAADFMPREVVVSKSVSEEYWSSKSQELSDTG